MLDPTQREADLLSSIKKHMVDCLTPLNIPVFFEYLQKSPVNSSGTIYSKWCCCVLGDRGFDTVGEAQLVVVAFTREDNEGDSLASLSDSIMECFLDVNASNGMKLITYYNTTTAPWTSVGGIVPFVGIWSELHNGRDLTKFKILPVTLKWGSK